MLAQGIVIMTVMMTTITANKKKAFFLNDAVCLKKNLLSNVLNCKFNLS